MLSGRFLVAAGLVLLGVVLTHNSAMAARYESDNYTIDASVGNSFGGSSISDGYQMVSSGGESIVGNGAGGSYILDQGYVAQLSKSLQLTVQPKGLAAYYSLDEPSGSTVVDHSANSNNGNIDGGATRLTGGRVGGGLKLNGVDSKVVVPNHDSLNNQTTTVSAWVKLDVPLASQPDNYPAIVSKRGSNRGFALYLFKGEQEVQVSLGNGSSRVIHDVGVSMFDWTQWRYVAFTYDGNELIIYVDDQPVGQLELEDQLVGSTTDMWIGDITDYAGSVMAGSIDEVKVYSRALSKAEMVAEYEAGLAGHVAGLSFDGEIIPGASRISEAEAIVETDAPGYSLALQQSSHLTSDNGVIPGISTGSISSPANWSEGATIGLGFSLAASNTDTIPAKWNSGQAYAPLPSSSTVFYSRSGYSQQSKDIVEIRYRLDVARDQPTGQYKNTVIYTGTMLP